jgi:hypothetical protein
MVHDGSPMKVRRHVPDVSGVRRSEIEVFQTLLLSIITNLWQAS